MTLILLLYILAPLALAALMHASGNRSRRALIAVPVAFYCLPVLVVTGLYLFRAPIQQGRFLADLGPVLSLVFPPDDLYEPLAATSLRSGKQHYRLEFRHRYVGHHSLEISIPGGAPISKLGQDLQVLFEVSNGTGVIFRSGPAGGTWFRGRDDHGLHFTRYAVPGDLPVAEPLSAAVSISGDLERFLQGRENATLGITKVSDE